MCIAAGKMRKDFRQDTLGLYQQDGFWDDLYLEYPGGWSRVPIDMEGCIAGVGDRQARRLKIQDFFGPGVYG